MQLKYSLRLRRMLQKISLINFQTKLKSCAVSKVGNTMHDNVLKEKTSKIKLKINICHHAAIKMTSSFTILLSIFNVNKAGIVQLLCVAFLLISEIRLLGSYTTVEQF